MQTQRESRPRTRGVEYQDDATGCLLHAGGGVRQDSDHGFGTAQVCLHDRGEFLGRRLQPGLDELCQVARDPGEHHLDLNTIFGAAHQVLNVIDRLHLFITRFDELPTIVMVG